MGAFLSILDFVLNFPVVEFILVVGVMCVVTDGIAKARNRVDRIALEIPEGRDFSADETAAAHDRLDSVQRSIESGNVKVEQIVASEHSDKTSTTNQSDNLSSSRGNDLDACDANSVTDNEVTDNEVTDNEVVTTKENNLECLPETDQLRLGLGQEWMNQRIPKCNQLSSANYTDHLTEQDASRNTSDNDNTSAGSTETTTDLMSVDDKITDVNHADRKDSNESGIYSSEDGTKSKSSIDSSCEWCDIEEYPTFDDRLNLLSSNCESEKERRRHLTDHSDDAYQTISSSTELFHRPQSEGRSHQERLSNDGWNHVEQVELLRQDRDTISLWNEMILEDNARLHNENLRLRQENEDMTRENERLKEEHMWHQSQLHFQLVFVGDSGVGKTSFIRRVCEDKFSPQFNSTVGVDFQSKTLDVDERQVVLQMWDTAGQERFRSITRQYFRKADVAVVMYDVTSEVSFKNVRCWMHDVQEGSDDATVVVVIGNKRDLIVSDVISRQVTTTDGAELAKVFNAFFYETSAKTGEYVEESLYDIVRLLIERKQLNSRHSIHSIVRLDKSRQQSTKPNCCGGNVRQSTH